MPEIFKVKYDKIIKKVHRKNVNRDSCWKVNT